MEGQGVGGDLVISKDGQQFFCQRHPMLDEAIVRVEWAGGKIVALKSKIDEAG